MKKNLLVTLANEPYIPQAKQLFSSAYFNSGWKGEYMLLAHEIPESKLKWFRKKGILIKKVKSLDKNVSGRYNDSTHLSKLYLFTKYFKKWKNIVYLDADIIIRHPVEELTNVRGIAAPKEVGNLKLIEEFSKIKRNRNLYLELKNEYNLKKIAFNTGILAFSTNIIKESAFRELVELKEKYRDYLKHSDQTVFNLYFYKEFKSLPIVYNICPGYLENYCKIRNDKIKGIIIHFCYTKETKPWLKESKFNLEWEKNLIKADQIDLSKRISQKDKWSKKEILKYEKYVQFNEKRNQLISYIRHKIGGKIGDIIHEKSPKIDLLIQKLRKIFSKINTL